MPLRSAAVKLSVTSVDLASAASLLIRAVQVYTVVSRIMVSLNGALTLLGTSCNCPVTVFRPSIPVSNQV